MEGLGKSHAKVPGCFAEPLLFRCMEQFSSPAQVARRSDMDMNGHVNNTVFLGMLMEAVPQDIHDGCHMFQVWPTCLGNAGSERASRLHCLGFTSGGCCCR